MTPPSRHELATYARRYDAMGMSVVVLWGVEFDVLSGQARCTCPKAGACTSPGKHPVLPGWQHGPTDLTPLGRQHVSLNLGLRTGPVSGFFAVDVDDPDTWRALSAPHAPLERTRFHRSGSAGKFHLTYSLPDFPVTNSTGRLPKGIDVRGDGGQIVAPPSLHASGRRYTEGEGTENMAPQPAPGWLLDFIRPAERITASSAAPTTGREADATRPQTKREAALERSVIDGELARLDDLPRPWVPLASHWDTTTYEVACQLIELANAGWSDLTVEQAHELVLGRAPRDDVWGERKIEEKWTSALRKVGAKARVSPSVDGRDDALSPDYAGPVILAATPAPASQPVEAGRRKPELVVTGGPQVVAWIRGNLGTGPTSDVFVMGGRVVRVVGAGDPDWLPPRHRGDDDGPAQVTPFGPEQLQSQLSARYDVRRPARTEGETIPATVPLSACREALATPDNLEGPRPLVGVTHTPIVRADGSILDTPGYDTASRMAYLPERGLIVPAVPETPTAGDVARARELIHEPFADFPFASDSDRVNALGSLSLSPIIRLLAPPPYKAVAINAHQPGSGKTLLAQLGGDLHGMVMRGELPSDIDEQRKDALTILSQTTPPLVVHDNVGGGIIRSSLYAALWTSDVLEGRRLGVNEQIRCRNDRLWVVTGNNLAFGGDLPRRVLVTTLDPGMPNPQNRTGFRHADLRRWVREHRGELLWALLVLVRAWHVAGRPGPALVPDSYGLWRQTVSGILSHAGIPGTFDDPRTSLDPVGADDTEWADFLVALDRVFGDRPFTAAEVVAQLDTSSFPGSQSPVLPLHLEDLPGELSDKLRGPTTGARALARPLGKWLRNRSGRWAGDLCVRPLGRNSSNVTRYRIDRAGDTGSDSGRSAAPESQNPGDTGGTGGVYPLKRNEVGVSTYVGGAGNASGVSGISGDQPASGWSA